MKSRISAFFLILLFSAASFAFAPGRDGAEDEILVKFKPGTSAARQASIISRTKSRKISSFADLGWHRIKLPTGLSVKEAVAVFLSSDNVEAAQPNFYYRLLAVPNDDRFSDLWAMTKISAPQAWDISTGDPSVVIANIDSGTRYDHEDLVANMWVNPGEIPGNGIDDDGNGFIDDIYGYDFYHDNPDPSDENGHGTHTAGTMGAVGNNSIGVTGVNWNVRIMSIKIFDAAGQTTTSSMLINAYNYVRMMKKRGVNVRVTNNSYAGCNEACGYDQATKDAIDALGDAGIMQVFASGNDGQNTDVLPKYPGSYTSPSIISVANSNTADNRNSTSNYGVTSVDLAAPGSGILSTTLHENNYGGSTGTSMAAPHVAGAVALLAAHDPSLSAASLKASILNSVDVLPQWSSLVKAGGRLNVAAALQSPTICSFKISNTSIKLPTKGGHASITIAAPPNCDLEVKRSVRWIYPMTPSEISGNGTFTFRVGVNPTISRSGTLTIAGTNISVIQSRN